MVHDVGRSLCVGRRDSEAPPTGPPAIDAEEDTHTCDTRIRYFVRADKVAESYKPSNVRKKDVSLVCGSLPCGTDPVACSGGRRPADLRTQHAKRGRGVFCVL